MDGQCAPQLLAPTSFQRLSTNSRHTIPICIFITDPTYRAHHTAPHKRQQLGFRSAAVCGFATTRQPSWTATLGTAAYCTSQIRRLSHTVDQFCSTSTIHHAHYLVHAEHTQCGACTHPNASLYISPWRTADCGCKTPGQNTPRRAQRSKICWRIGVGAVVPEQVWPHFRPSRKPHSPRL